MSSKNKLFYMTVRGIPCEYLAGHRPHWFKVPVVLFNP